MPDPQLNDVWKSLVAPVGGDIESDWCQSAEYYDVYRAVGRALQPSTILEIGTRVGHSLISLAIDNPRLRSIAWIDNESYVAGSNAKAAANIAASLRKFRPDWNLPKMMWSASHELAPVYGLFELCHIDGDHSYEGKIRDLDFCAGLSPNWLLVDDYAYHEPVHKAVTDWCLDRGQRLFSIPTFRGLAFIPLYGPLEFGTLKLLTLEGGLSVKAVL